MATAVAPKTPVDPWQTSKETWQYVTIPEEDATGVKFPSISLNKTTFYPGETYQVPPQVAAYVVDRIKTYNKSTVRLFSGRADIASLNQVSVGTANITPSGDKLSFVDATKITTL